MWLNRSEIKEVGVFKGHVCNIHYEWACDDNGLKLCLMIRSS